MRGRMLPYREQAVTLGSRQPIFWLALAFAGGVGLGLALPVFLCALAAVLGGTAAFFCRKYRPGWAFLPMLLAAMALGALAMGMAVPEWLGKGELTGRAENLRGRVVVREYGADGDKLILDQVSFIKDGREVSVSGRVRVTLYASEGTPTAPEKGFFPVNALNYSPAVAVGDTLLLAETELQLPAVALLPGMSHNRNAMLSRGVRFTAAVGIGEAWVSPGSGFLRWVDQLRQRLYDGMTERMGKTGASLAGALTLGYTDDLDEDASNAFRRLGISHLLAVSGLHVSLLLVLLRKLARRVAIGRTVFLVLEFVLIGAYCLLAGARPAFIRVLFMALFRTLALALRRKPDSLCQLSMAFVLHLALNPWALWAMDFQLSYLATLVLCLFDRDGRRYGAWAPAAVILLLLPFGPTGALPLFGLLANLILAPVYSVFLAMALADLPLSLTPLSGLWGRLLGFFGEKLLLVTEKLGSLAPTLRLSFLRYFPLMAAASALAMLATPRFLGEKPLWRRITLGLAAALAALALIFSALPKDRLTAGGSYGTASLLVESGGQTTLLAAQRCRGLGAMAGMAGQLDELIYLGSSQEDLLSALEQLEEIRPAQVRISEALATAALEKRLALEGYEMATYGAEDCLRRGCFTLYPGENCADISAGGQLLAYGSQAMPGNLQIYSQSRAALTHVRGSAWVANLPCPAGLDESAQNGYNIAVSGAWQWAPKE